MQTDQRYDNPSQINNGNSLQDRRRFRVPPGSPFSSNSFSTICESASAPCSENVPDSIEPEPLLAEAQSLHHAGLPFGFSPPNPHRTTAFAANLVQLLHSRGWERRAYLHYGFLGSMFKPTQPFLDSDHLGVESIQKYLRSGLVGCMLGVIPRQPRERRRLLAIKRGPGRESDEHLFLKGDGLQFLRSLGFADAHCEGYASYCGADVKTDPGSIAIEVGDTAVTRACHALGGNPAAVISLPYCHGGRAICIFATALGRFQGALMDACRLEDTRQKMDAYFDEIRAGAAA